MTKRFAHWRRAVSAVVLAVTACGPERSPRPLSSVFAPPTAASSAAAPSPPTSSRDVGWSATGARVVAGDVLFDVIGRRTLQTRCAVDGPGAPRRPLWSGDAIVACSRRDGQVEIHDVESGRANHIQGAAVAWDRPGRYLLVESGASFSVWDRRSASVFMAPQGFDRAAWLGGGSILRLTHLPGGEEQLWDVVKRAFVGTPGTPGRRAVAPSGSHELELPSTSTDAFLVDAVTGARYPLCDGVTAFDGPPDALRFFSPDSATVAVPVARSGVRLFDTKTHTTVGALAAPGCETPIQIAWSGKGDLVAVGSVSSHICLFDATTRDFVRSWEVPLRSHTDSHPTSSVLLLAFFARDRGLIAGNWDGQGYSLSVWELPAGNEREPHGGYATLDGVRVTTHGDALTESARVGVDLVFEDEVVPWLRDVADISAEGRYVVADAEPESTTLKTVGLPLPAFEHADGAVFISVSPDGAKVLGTARGETRIWDLATGSQLLP